MQYLILTESGLGVGYGHLMRCNTIRDELIKRGKKVELLNHKVCSYPKNEGHWSQFSLNCVENCIVLVDSYIVDAKWLTRNLKNCKYSIVLDDFNRIKYPVDLIVNPNVFYKDLDYSNQHARSIGGPDYVLLRESFRKQLNPNCKEEIILITLGGSDYRNLITRLVRIARGVTNLPIVVVDPRNESEKIPGVEYLGFLDAQNMLLQYQSAKVVISAAGQTLHELASLKKKCLGICIDEDQVPNHKFYNEIGFIRGNIHWDSKSLETDVAIELARLISEDASTVFDDIVNRYGIEKLVDYFEKYAEST